MLLDGKALSEKIKDELAKTVADLGITPGLAVILAGNDPASRVYVNNKKKACERCGIRSEEYTFPETVTEKELLELIDALNRADHIHGILVQLPLPRHIDETKIIRAISPDKDVDAFTPENVGKIMIGDYDFLPCTPAGVMELIHSSGIEVAGKRCVVVGRSNIVGKPQAMLLLHEHGTVTVCHSRTKDLFSITREAEILVVAVGKAKFLPAEAIRPGAVVIDVGMNRDENGKLCGDVDFEAAKDVAGAITPVPGGVGPITIAMLMKNTVRAATKGR